MYVCIAGMPLACLTSSLLYYSLDKIDGEIKIATSIVQTVERKKNSARKNIAQKEKELQKMELDLANLVPEDNLEQCKATAEGRRQKASEEVLEKTTRTQAANMESHYLRTRRR